jgi:hypothetical protein
VFFGPVGAHGVFSLINETFSKVPGSSPVPAPPWVGSRSPDGWDQIPYRPGGWVLHQPPWSFGFDNFDSHTRGTRENIQDWISWNCQQLGLPIPHLLEFKDHACTCDRFAIDEYSDRLHSCTQHAGAMTGAHEHILTAVQRLFNQAGYTTERKNVPHSRGMKKADLHVKDFRLEGIQDVIIDVTLRDEFHGSCIDPAHNGEASYADPNGAIDAAVKAKLDNYQHDYSERNFFFLPAVMTTSGRISGVGLPPPAVYSIPPSSCQLLHTHGHP